MKIYVRINKVFIFKFRISGTLDTIQVLVLHKHFSVDEEMGGVWSAALAVFAVLARGPGRALDDVDVEDRDVDEEA